MALLQCLHSAARSVSFHVLAGQVKARANDMRLLRPFQTNANISKYGKKRRNHNNRSFQKRRRRIPVNGPIRGPKRPETGPLHDYPRTSSYHGVSADSDNVGMFMVRICVSDTEIDGGTHRGELAAAHAYDSLITMLELDDEFPLNFKDEVGDSWQPLREHDDDVGDVNVGRYDNCIIPVVQNELFTLEEVCEGLKDLKGVGIDHVSVDQSGLSGVSYMVFVTGRTPPHMRRMADELVRCLRARGVMLPWGAYPNVEGRDDSDWMLVDASNMFIHIMSETAREALQLEDHWGGMKAGQDRHADLIESLGGVSSFKSQEEIYDRLVQELPIPEDYMNQGEVDADIATIPMPTQEDNPSSY